MTDPKRQWEYQDSVGFRRGIGNQPGDKVLEFGCRVGHYSIPAAFVVGHSRMVYALDEHQSPLDQLIEKGKDYGLSNITAVRTPSRIQIDIVHNTIDVVLLYDVLHYFTPRDRRRLYEEAGRVLTPAGLLSVYPKRTVEDVPSKEFTETRLSDVERDIQISGFELDGRWDVVISHDNAFQRDYVLNFRKRRRVW